MKYIRPYNIKESKLYITVNDFGKNDDREPFNNKEIKKIKESCPNHKIHNREVLDKHSNYELFRIDGELINTNGIFSKKSKYEQQRLRDNKRFSIFKLEDEWFLLMVGTYGPDKYRCDQLEGLIQCLKDKVNI